MNKVLKLLRMAYMLNITELAAKLDVTQSYLSKIEAGKETPSEDLLSKYQEVFKIKVSTIKHFSETDNEKKINDQELFLQLLQKICDKSDAVKT